MSVITGTPAVVGGGSAINVAYGLTPPTDFGKLWIQTANKPNKLTAKYTLAYGNNVLTVADTNKVPEYQSVNGWVPPVQVGDSIYSYCWKGDNLTPSILKYSMTSHTWETLTPNVTLSMDYYRSAASLVVGHKIYMFGGVGSQTNITSTKVAIYDVDSNTLSTSTSSTDRYMIGGGWIQQGDLIYGFGTTTQAGVIYCYNITEDTFTDASAEFTAEDTTLLRNYGYPLFTIDAGNGVYYLIPCTATFVNADRIVKVNMGTKTVTAYKSMAEAFPAQTPEGDTKTYTYFAFDAAGTLQVGSAAYIVGGMTGSTGSAISSPLIWKINVSAGELDISTLDVQLYSKQLSTTVRNCCGIYNNELNIVQYYTLPYGGASTDQDNIRNQILTLYSPLTQNDIFMQVGSGNDIFNIVDTNKSSVEIAIKAVYQGDTNNEAQLVPAYLYDTVNSLWKNIVDGSEYSA